jgi:hypothetical protein
MDRSMKIFRQLEQDFDPYRMIFLELNWGGRGEAPVTMVLQKKIKNKK